MTFFSNIPSLPTYVSWLSSSPTCYVSFFYDCSWSAHFSYPVLGLFMVCLLCIHVSSYDCSQFAYLCLIVWLFMVYPLLMSHLMTVASLLLMTHLMIVPSLPTCYVSSYDCSQSVFFLRLILWLFPVCLFISHLMTLHDPPTVYVSPYDCFWSVCFLCLILWLFPVCLSVCLILWLFPACLRLVIVPSLILWLFPVHAIFSRLGVCTVSEAQVDLQCDY